MSDKSEAPPEESQAAAPDDAPKRPVRKKKKYVPAVTPRLRIALNIVFVLFALLAANSVYLAAITFLDYISDETYQDFFYLCMFMLHLVLGFLLITPFILFAGFHLMATRKRKNRRAVRIGYALLTFSIILLVSGVLLTRVGDVGLKHELSRQVVYWAHVLAPLAAIWMYWLHRLAGPPIKWRIGLTYAGAVAVILVPMIYLQSQDPRQWSVVGSKDGIKYFEPSLSRTNDGNWIPASALDNDEYCLKCHQDVYESWTHSAHRFSSFNNPAYLTSIVELREELLERDGNVRASRWCAGCHDPVPFFSGKFDDPEFDVFTDPTAHSGITCTTCHAITNVNSPRGNADYTIEEPVHYPFAYSENPVLQWINNQLVKAKPSFHKKVMLKPLHQSAEFCATCHKVHLPKELTHYKDFLRGQNHYDSWLVSGVSGHGLKSFYYPPEAQTNCNGCHMQLVESDDFGAKDFDGSGQLKVHDHLFPSANTAIAWLNYEDDVIKAHQDFLEGVMRVDIFGIKQGDNVETELIGPLRADPTRPQDVPALSPGERYLFETVIRTVKMGHHFTQGTGDSNEIWMDVTVVEGAEYDAAGQRTGGTVIGRSGGFDEVRAVDPWAHFVNIFMLDKDGYRINRRNAHQIFTPLYNHQMPPGAGQVVHYQFDVPPTTSLPITLEVKLQYRKFDQEYMNIIAEFHRENNLELRGLDDSIEYVNQLPVTTLAHDRITLPIEGITTDEQMTDVGALNADGPNSEVPLWQRWNDYGIGLLLEGATQGVRGELRQAEEAFTRVEELGQFHGPINLARVYESEGRTSEMVDALNRATEEFGDVQGFPTWTVSWLNGVANMANSEFDLAIENFEHALYGEEQARVDRNFDFSRDYRVINSLAQAYLFKAQSQRRQGQMDLYAQSIEKCIDTFEEALTHDPENVAAHKGLSDAYLSAGEEALAEEHRELSERYKPDDNAPEVRTIARQRYPAGNAAAEALVIYKLQREGAPELPPGQATETSHQQESTNRPSGIQP